MYVCTRFTYLQGKYPFLRCAPLFLYSPDGYQPTHILYILKYQVDNKDMAVVVFMCVTSWQLRFVVGYCRASLSVPYLVVFFRTALRVHSGCRMARIIIILIVTVIIIYRDICKYMLYIYIDGYLPCAPFFWPFFMLWSFTFSPTGY